MPVLGQVAITQQAGFGGAPWSLSTPLRPGMSFPSPYGAPKATEENTAAWHCPDGTERILTVAQARARGCTRRVLGQDGPRATFEMGFQRQAWKPTLGVTIEEAITKGAETYKAYAEKETAEAQAEAKQAEAEAARIRAAAAAAAGVKPPEKKILGIPVSYLLYGGLGLGALAAILLVMKKK